MAYLFSATIMGSMHYVIQHYIIVLLSCALSKNNKTKQNKKTNQFFWEKDFVWYHLRFAYFIYIVCGIKMQSTDPQSLMMLTIEFCCSFLFIFVYFFFFISTSAASWWISYLLMRARYHFRTANSLKMFSLLKESKK